MRLLTVFGVSLIAAAQLQAHDFWLSPSEWEPVPATAGVTITGNVGDKFPEVSDWAIPEGVDTWRVIGPTGNVPVQTPGPSAFKQQGQSIVTSVSLGPAGAYMGLMTVKSRTFAQEAGEFNDYLKEEGIADVLAERTRLGQLKAPVRERYARYSKVIVRKGGGPAAYITAPAGHEAELVPAADPTTLNPGQPLVLQLLVEGKPIAGAALIAVSGKWRLDMRTDTSGRASFALPDAGPWLIKTVYMRHPAVPGSPRVDWESYWVTLTFRAGGR